MESSMPKSRGVSPVVSTEWKNLILLFVACALLYYSYAIAGAAGLRPARNALSGLHNFFGIDFFALVFFLPVVYAAYALGIAAAVKIALASVFVIMPEKSLNQPFPSFLFKPAAYAIILSSVGATVALVQRSDSQRHAMIRQLQCLHDVGMAADSTRSTAEFLGSVTGIIQRNANGRDKAGIRISVGGKTFVSTNFDGSGTVESADIIMGGRVAGQIQISSRSLRQAGAGEFSFAASLAERVGGVLQRLELEESLRRYSDELENMVSARTKDLERAQEQLVRSEKLAAVGELASSVAHELRNPLNVIKNCVYLLNMKADGKAGEEFSDTLKLLDRQVDTSSKIIADLLDFTRIRKPNLAKVDLHSLIEDCLKSVPPNANVSMIKSYGGRSPQVLADSEQITRAFVNIITNAIQSINGRGEIRVGTGTEAAARNVWIKFEDTGCGIPQEHIGSIFEPLFTTKPKGLGLGLAITKRLIEQNAGTIEVSSQISKGTSFTVKLPVYGNGQEL